MDVQLHIAQAGCFDAAGLAPGCALGRGQQDEVAAEQIEGRYPFPVPFQEEMGRTSPPAANVRRSIVP